MQEKHKKKIGRGEKKHLDVSVNFIDTPAQDHGFKVGRWHERRSSTVQKAHGFNCIALRGIVVEQDFVGSMSRWRHPRTMMQEAFKAYDGQYPTECYTRQRDHNVKN